VSAYVYFFNEIDISIEVLYDDGCCTSTTVTDACHAKFRVIFPLYIRIYIYFSTLMRFSTIRAPENPMGWPKATAPPQTLTLSRGISRSFILASTVAANASFISWYSI